MFVCNILAGRKYLKNTRNVSDPEFQNLQKLAENYGKCLKITGFYMFLLFLFVMSVVFGKFSANFCRVRKIIKFVNCP